MKQRTIKGRISIGTLDGIVTVKEHFTGSVSLILSKGSVEKFEQYARGIDSLNEAIKTFNPKKK